MTSTLKSFRNGALGFIGWLDFGTWLINGLIVIWAVALASLPSASRTSLYIAACGAWGKLVPSGLCLMVLTYSIVGESSIVSRACNMAPAQGR